MGEAKVLVRRVPARRKVDVSILIARALRVATKGRLLLASCFGKGEIKLSNHCDPFVHPRPQLSLYRSFHGTWYIHLSSLPCIPWQPV